MIPLSDVAEADFCNIALHIPAYRYSLVNQAIRPQTTLLHHQLLSPQLIRSDTCRTTS